jgi:hypothetical protein
MVVYLTIHPNAISMPFRFVFQSGLPLIYQAPDPSLQTALGPHPKDVPCMAENSNTTNWNVYILGGHFDSIISNRPSDDQNSYFFYGYTSLSFL